MARFGDVTMKVKVVPGWSFVLYWMILVFTFVAGFICGRYAHLLDNLFYGPCPC